MSDAFAAERKILYMGGVSAEFFLACFFFDRFSDIFVFHPFESLSVTNVFVRGRKNDTRKTIYKIKKERVRACKLSGEIT